MKFAALALPFVLLLSGCQANGTGTPEAAADSPKLETAYLTEGAAADEYRASIQEIPLPLPDGVEFPPGLPADFVPEDGVLENGAARNQAWFTWLCAWEGEYLATVEVSDSQAFHAASMIASWSEMEFYQNVVEDPSHGWVTNVVEPLQVGDYSGVQADYRHMCGQFPLITE